MKRGQRKDSRGRGDDRQETRRTRREREDESIDRDDRERRARREEREPSEAESRFRESVRRGVKEREEEPTPPAAEKPKRLTLGPGDSATIVVTPQAGDLICGTYLGTRTEAGRMRHGFAAARGFVIVVPGQAWISDLKIPVGSGCILMSEGAEMGKEGLIGKGHAISIGFANFQEKPKPEAKLPPPGGAGPGEDREVPDGVPR